MFKKSSKSSGESRVAVDRLAQLVDTFVPPFGGDAITAADLEIADRRARFWKADLTGPLVSGSSDHKQAVCQMFRETFNPYKPSVIDWPTLAPDELHRLTSLPIWDIAVQTEGRARVSFAAYAATLDDPGMQSVLLLNAWEENRHRQVLTRLVETYGIQLAEEKAQALSNDPQWGFLSTGYSECIDSFFAFGLFALARQSGFFPAALVETFEPVIQEECRHILLFANWLSWHRANLTAIKRVQFEIKVLAVWIQILWQRMLLARTIGGGQDAARLDSNFTVNSAQTMSNAPVSIHMLLTLCLSENTRRFAGYDARLARPTTVPMLARWVRFCTDLWPGAGGQ